MSEQVVRWCTTHNNSVTRSNRGRCDMLVMLPDDYVPLKPCRIEEGRLFLGVEGRAPDLLILEQQR